MRLECNKTMYSVINCFIAKAPWCHIFDRCKLIMTLILATIKIANILKALKCIGFKAIIKHTCTSLRRSFFWSSDLSLSDELLHHMLCCNMPCSITQKQTKNNQVTTIRRFGYYTLSPFFIHLIIWWHWHPPCTGWNNISISGMICFRDLHQWAWQKCWRKG